MQPRHVPARLLGDGDLTLVGFGGFGFGRSLLLGFLLLRLPPRLLFCLFFLAMIWFCRGGFDVVDSLRRVLARRPAPPAPFRKEGHLTRRPFSAADNLEVITAEPALAGKVSAVRRTSLKTLDERKTCHYI